MSLSFLDLRDMDSEMETAGIVGPTMGWGGGGQGGPQEQKPLQQACVSAAQLYPTLHGIWAEQAPSRCLLLPLSDSEGSAFLSETSFQRGSRSFTH